MGAAITFEQVGFSYGNKKLFDKLSFSIGSNRLTCLLGSTGSGKTTILRLMSGFAVPVGGSVIINDKVVASEGMFVPPAGRKVGMIFQDLALWPHFTVFKNIEWGLRHNHVENAEQKIADMLESFNIRALAERYPHELSGGQQQLVALARSLVLDPKILLLDEPLSNLDSRAKAMVRKYILDLKQEFDITLVYVTHDYHDAFKLADEILVLSENGEIMLSGEKAHVVASPEFRNLVEGDISQ